MVIQFFLDFEIKAVKKKIYIVGGKYPPKIIINTLLRMDTQDIRNDYVFVNVNVIMGQQHCTV